MMNDKEFHQIADKLLNDVESHIDELSEDYDVDCESHGNVMTITIANRHHIVINKQEPFHQIWLASPNDGFHFDYVNDQWICSRSQQAFSAILSHEINQLLEK